MKSLQITLIVLAITSGSAAVRAERLSVEPLREMAEVITNMSGKEIEALAIVAPIEPRAVSPEIQAEIDSLNIRVVCPSPELTDTVTTERVTEPLSLAPQGRSLLAW